MRDSIAMTMVARKARQWDALRNGLAAALVFAIGALSYGAHAYAVSDNVKNACRNDYFQHCSQFAVGSEELRQCMRGVGENLSTPCLVALVQEGEITKEDVERHNAGKAGGTTKKKSQEVAATDASDPKDVSAKADSATKTTKKKKGKKSTAGAEGSATTKAEASGTKAPGKSAKAKKAGKVATGGAAAKTSGKTAKKKGAAKSASAGTSNAAATGTSASAKSKKKAGTTSVAAGKKKTTGTAGKTKKTAKKKTAKSSSKKALDAQTP
ncbi:hypothetical protein [Hyphomicrobium sp.]|uniref:hypothetical protein n=1 Tax=Hyphomicrobium sp. TaxID=82 RepID=UPI0025BABEEF|nr:hypothetical protein [Hyphomicrobium sp.]